LVVSCFALSALAVDDSLPHNKDTKNVPMWKTHLCKFQTACTLRSTSPAEEKEDIGATLTPVASEQKGFWREEVPQLLTGFKQINTRQPVKAES
jgi:hypothetical protein